MSFSITTTEMWKPWNRKITKQQFDFYLNARFNEGIFLLRYIHIFFINKPSNEMCVFCNTTIMTMSLQNVTVTYPIGLISETSWIFVQTLWTRHIMLFHYLTVVVFLITTNLFDNLMLIQKFTVVILGAKYNLACSKDNCP